jgi:peptidoglycan/xylan/chitin deacetylase (PgdA/CDA1 family)
MFILNLHGIGTPRRELPASEQKVWIEDSQFLQILDYVKARSDVDLTFDDANESDFTIALPALQSRGLKARFFIVAERIGSPAFLAPSQLHSLRGAGMALGNHGMRHRRWVGLDNRELHEELVEARDRLEQLAGVKIAQASCPFGSYNRRVVRALRGAGYSAIYTSDRGPAQPGALILPRNTVHRTWKLENIQAILTRQPKGARWIWRNLKLILKRWR